MRSAGSFAPDLFLIAETTIAGLLADQRLSPTTIAESLNVSRAAVYRIFAPVGGVMEHVWAMRLEAVRAAIDQPPESRTLIRLAADYGFKSSAHLSRSFRKRFGSLPRDWRRQAASTAQKNWLSEVPRLNGLWHDLGH